MTTENKLIKDADGDPEKLRARLRELEARLQDEKLLAVGRLAGGVAHDLNNMLTPILAYGNIVLDELPPDSPLREYMREVVKAGDRALAMTKVLQSLRTKTGGLMPLPLNDAVTAQLDKARAELTSAFTLAVELHPDAGSVMSDGGMVEKIVDEMVRNAHLAMPAGGTITVRTDRVDEAGTWFAVLTIKDEGSGMTPDVRAHIGEPYYSTRPKGQGKGLGLAQVYAAVRRVDGFIRCRSEVGTGTEFRVFFPCA